MEATQRTRTIDTGVKPMWLTATVSLMLLALTVVIRFWVWKTYFVPIGYAVPLLLFLWLRDRRFLWIVTLCFGVMTWYKLFFYLTDPAFELHRDVALAFQTADLVLVAAILHYVIGTRLTILRRNAALAETNEDLARREEEIARQNEELQSQTEELERQSEELRVTNDELAHRERTLEHLLALSRSLATYARREDIMSAVCEALGFLMNGRSPASAILQRQGDHVVVVCHHGFGSAGLENDSIPMSNSFASLVLNRGQTAYIEDLSLRPDLKVPQSRDGPRMRSVLATPLRVKGRPVGALEVYSPEPRHWSEQHVALLESLAAQTSVSLESAELLSDVHDERTRLKAILETAPVGICIADKDWTNVRLNPAAAAMFNVSVDTNLGSPGAMSRVAVFAAGKVLSFEQYPMVQAIRTGRVITGVEVEAEIGSRRAILLLSAAPIIGRDGEVTGSVGSFVDISAMKQLQRELDRRRREAEEASVRKTRFLAAVSHDIRTPANAINLLAELMRRTATNAAMAREIPSLAEEMQNSASSLVNLVSDVLDLTRFDSGRIELNETEFDLIDAVTTEVRQMQPVAQDKGLRIDLEAPSSPIQVRTDRIKLARVISNLLGNAIKFTSKGKVSVRVAMAADRRALVHVSDTGVGIEPENLDRIFDEFFQLRNPERDAAKGTGLGLTICKRLVDAMGGEMLVESTLGAGSMFTIALPASSVIAQPVEPHSSLRRNQPHDGPGDGDGAARGEPSAFGSSRLDGVRVLIVDDHHVTRHSVAQILASQGARVAEAPTAQAALGLLQEFSPQILLLDMMLPDMNGREVLKFLKGARPPDLRKILILTGDTATINPPLARELGADDLIPKPIDVASLIEKVNINGGNGDGQSKC